MYTDEITKEILIFDIMLDFIGIIEGNSISVEMRNALCLATHSDLVLNNGLRTLKYLLE